MVTEIRPGTTFVALVDSWMFCGARLLLHKWERARVLAKTEAEFATLDKMEEQMRKEMERDARRDGKPIVLQASWRGLYAGPLIAGRFQVMESYTPAGTYSIADHARDDLLLRAAGPGSDVRRFASRADAEAWIKGFTGTPEPDIQGTSQLTEEAAMAKAATKTAPIPAPAKAAKPIGPKAAAKAKEAEAQMAEVKKSARGAKVAPAPAPEPTTKRGRSISTSGTMASVFRDLIMAGKLTDAAIHEKVEAQFGKKIAKNAVSHYRGVLVKNGQTPPPARG